MRLVLLLILNGTGNPERILRVLYLTSDGEVAHRNQEKSSNLFPYV